MQADYSVELGADDEVLEIPWSSPDGVLGYHDLRRHPELISEIPEATANPTLKGISCRYQLALTFFVRQVRHLVHQPTEPRGGNLWGKVQVRFLC